MRRDILLILFSILCADGFAQQVLVPIGLDLSGNEGIASITIGYTPFITDLQGQTGVQQPIWNYYAISTNSDIGTTTGDGTYKSGEVVTIAATSADVCYAFARWSDNDTSNPRQVVVTQDSTFTAIFEKIKYNLSVDINDTEHGEITSQEKE